MARRYLQQAILHLLAERAAQGQDEVSPQDIITALGAPPATVRRYLGKLLADEKVMRVGRTAATRYRLARPADRPAIPATVAPPRSGPVWTREAQTVLQALSAPLGARLPVTYQRRFVDDYQPNQHVLLPASLAHDLFDEGRMRGQQPAGTYARKVLEPLLIDLSYSSSRLEGNRYTRLATEELFRVGKSDASDVDAVMLLNHKAAIEFLIDSVPQYGMAAGVIRNLHALLMQGLLADEDGLGAIRHKVVHITDTAYVPTQVPSLLAEMFDRIVEKARHIRNPAEAAFFLWVNLAYLQPFEDGNKRTSRLSANIPLMLYNCAPLSFLDVGIEDYNFAMMAVYERLDIRLAAELFAWTYRRSIQKYATLLEAVGLPDPFRARHRDAISEVIQRVVRDRDTLSVAVDEVGMPQDVRDAFVQMVREDLQRLGEHNCARYRLTMRQVAEWIEAGRPDGRH